MTDGRKGADAFPELLARMRETFRQHDPSGLFALGAPLDEHDTSIHRIISRLQHLTDAGDVPAVLEAELGPWIADRGHDPRTVCRSMAPAIWSAWCAFRDAAG